MISKNRIVVGVLLFSCFLQILGLLEFFIHERTVNDFLMQKFGFGRNTMCLSCILLMISTILSTAAFFAILATRRLLKTVAALLVSVSVIVDIAYFSLEWGHSFSNEHAYLEKSGVVGSGIMGGIETWYVLLPLSFCLKLLFLLLYRMSARSGIQELS